MSLKFRIGYLEKKKFLNTKKLDNIFQLAYCDLSKKNWLDPTGAGISLWTDKNPGWDYSLAGTGTVPKQGKGITGATCGTEWAGETDHPLVRWPEGR